MALERSCRASSERDCLGRNEVGSLVGFLRRDLEGMKIAVLGLGYVGCPLLRRCLEKGLEGVGFDINERLIASLSKGISGMTGFDASVFPKVIEEGSLRLSSDPSVLKEAEAIMICLPTPLTKQQTPDLSFVLSGVEAITKHASKGVLVVLESTTYPGTTVEVLQPLLEKTFGKVGVDFYLGYSPEREDPGNPQSDFDNVPKVVSGVTEACRRKAIGLYSQIVKTVVPVSSCSTAEMVKIWENTFRAVNISAVNEMKIICDRMGIDVWEVIDVAKTKPYGFTPFYPGPGMGGHCIPVDPFYLTWKAKEYEIHTRFIELAGEVNFRMHAWVVAKVVQALNEQSKPARNANILVVGITYKADIGDLRESPAFPIMERLRELGACVDYSDPYIPDIPILRDYPFLKGKKSFSLSPNTVAKYDVCLILTKHKNLPYETIAEHAQCIVDTRNCMSGYHPRCKVYKA